MVNTGEGQEDSRSLVRKQRVLFYTLRRFNKSQRRGGPGRSTGRDGGTSVWVSRDTGGPQGGPTPAGFPGPVILDDLGRVVALLRRVLGMLPGKLSAVQRECSLGALLDRLAAEHQGVAPPGEGMSEPVAPGALAALLDPCGIFESEAGTSGMGESAARLVASPAAKGAEHNEVMAEIKAAPLPPKEPEADPAGRAVMAGVREESAAVQAQVGAAMVARRPAAAGRAAAARAAAAAAVERVQPAAGAGHARLEQRRLHRRAAPPPGKPRGDAVKHSVGYGRRLIINVRSTRRSYV